MDHTKTIFAFIGCMVAGFLLIFFSRMSQQEGGEYGLMLANHQLNTYARENCAKAARSRLQAPLYTPSETHPDGADAVVLNWAPTQDQPKAVACRYQQGKGVAWVKIDGVSIGPVSIDISSDPASRAPGAWVEKHH